MSDAVSELKAEIAARSSARSLRSPRNLPPVRRSGGASSSSLETSLLTTDRINSRRDRSSKPRTSSTASNRNVDSTHSRSSVGSKDLDDISESDVPRSFRTSSRRARNYSETTTTLNDVSSDGLARAKDRIQSRKPHGSSGGSVASSSSSSRPRRNHSDLGASESSDLNNSGHSRTSRVSRRRNAPRATKSNDDLDIMTITIENSGTSPTASQRVPRTPNRKAPSRSKSAGDALRKPTSADVTAFLHQAKYNDSAVTNGSEAGTGDSTEANASSRRSHRSSSNRRRSRSKSRGAKKRSGSRLAQIPNQDATKNDTSEQDRINAILGSVNGAAAASTASATTSTTTNETTSTVSSSSTRVRRKTSGKTSSLAAGLSMLDSLTPRPRIRDAKSVGPELQSPRKRTLPQRGMMRTASQEGGGISSLAAFLDGAPKKSNKLSSSRSVGADPSMGIGGGGGSKKPSRRRLKKSTKKGGGNDDSASARSSRSRTASSISSVGGVPSVPNRRAHSSLSSGLDLQTASSAPLRGRKPQRTTSSQSSSKSESVDESIDESLHVDDLIGGASTATKSSRRAARQRSSSAKATKRLSKSVSDMDFNASGLGLMIAQQKEVSRRDGGRNIFLDDADEQKVQEDVFVYYTWSTSHQPKHKQQTERLILNQTLRQGTFLKAFEAYCGKQDD